MNRQQTRFAKRASLKPNVSKHSHWHWISYATKDYDAETSLGTFLGAAIVDAPTKDAAEAIAREKGIAPAPAWALTRGVTFCEHVLDAAPQYANRLLQEADAMVAAAALGLDIDDPTLHIVCKEESYLSCHRLPLAREERKQHFFWLSFADYERFTGVAIMVAPTPDRAISFAHQKGINPGGSVLVTLLPSSANVPLGYVHRLLTQAEAILVAAAMDAEMVPAPAMRCACCPETGDAGHHTESTGHFMLQPSEVAR